MSSMVAGLCLLAAGGLPALSGLPTSHLEPWASVNRLTKPQKTCPEIAWNDFNQLCDFRQEALVSLLVVCL